MFGKFHRYNSRNREYIQTSGVEDQLIINSGNNELSIASKTDINRKRVDPRSQVTTGLIGWWRIDEGTGAFINDSSGIGSHGLINSTVNWTPGYLGKTAEFVNTVTNYINITPYVSNFNQLSQASFSVAFWFRITASAGSQQTFITLYESTTTNKYLIILRRPTSYLGGIYANMISFAFWGNDGHSTTAITDNKWHHFAGTYDYNSSAGTGTRKIYIDGNLESTENSINPLNFVPNTFKIANFDNGSGGLDGCINDMRIYNRGLTAGEVSTIYNLDSGDISKLTSNISAINTYTNQARNTSALIYNQPAFFNNSGIVGPAGDLISPAQPTRADSLVAWWPLNEGAGSVAYDKSGQNNTLTYAGTGGAVWDNAPPIGPYFSMDNNDQLATRSISSVDDLKITSAFSVCIWAKSNQATWSNFGVLMNNRINTTTNATFILSPNSGDTTISFFSSAINDTSYNITSNSIFDITQWTHYCGVYDGNELRLYINGILDPNKLQQQIPLLPVTNPVYLGYDIAGSARYLNGGLADSRIYNTALTSQEIISIMAERLQVTPRNINASRITWWPCNDGYDGRIMDYSGGNRHCTLLNNPVIQYTGPNGNKALKLDSTKSQWANTVTTYSLTSDLGVTNKFTVSAWLKSAGSTWNVDGAGVSNRSASGSTYGFIMHPNAGTKTMTFFINTTAGGSITSPAVDDITIWHHYVGVYDGAYLRLYIDGIQVATPVVRTNNVASTSLPIRLGGDYSSGNRYLNGEVSDVQLFNIALEPEEVSSIYNTTYTDYTETQTSELVPRIDPEPSPASSKTLQLQLTGQAFANTTFVTDYSGNQHHANIPVTSSVTYSAVSVISGVGPRSLLFNGTTGYLICDGIRNNSWAYKGVLGQTPRSFTCWINPTSLASTRTILSYGSGTGQSRGLFDIFLDTAGNVNVNLDNSGSSYVIKWDTRLLINTWQHLAFTLDQYGIMKCYKGTTSQQPATSNIATITNGLDTSALQVWLPFDDSFNGSTLVYDKSGSGNNGTLSSSAYITPGFGKFGNNVLQLSGSSSAVTTAYLPTLNSAFSWSIWVYPTTQAIEQPIISVTDNDGFWEASEFVYEIASDNVLKIGQNGAFGVGSNTAGPLIQSNIWTHLGLTYNGSGTYNIYVNGALTTTRANTSVVAPVGSTLTFGRYGSGTSPSASNAFFTGYMADFRAYNTALNSNQVANLYYNNLTDRVNTAFASSSNLQIGLGVVSSPYSASYYSGYMDDIRLYEGALLQSDIVNIWNGGSGSNSQVTPITNGPKLDLELIPLQGAEYPTTSVGYQAPALLSSAFGTVFSNKTITLIPTSASNYTWTTTNTVSWPPDSITGHTKVFFGAGQIDDAKFDLTGSNALVNSFTYYGTSYTYISACTNGHFSIGTPSDTNYNPTYALHYSLRRISMFFNDLMVTSTESPNGVYYGYKTETSANDVCVVTYYGIANLSNTGSRSNCQVKLYLNNSTTPGRIVMSFGTVQATNAVVGISNGTTPTDGISQGANLAVSANTSIINYNANTSIIPDSIFASSTALYNFSPTQTNAYYYGVDSNATPFYLRSGLVGWWKLDEQAGNTYYDISGTNQNGTFTGSSSSIQRMVGPYNTTCLNLEGNDRYISVYNGSSFPVTSSNLSISAWFNSSNISASRAILGLNTTGGLDRLPVFVTTSGTIQVLNGATSITSTTPVPVGCWNHLCITATSADPVSNIRVYLNSQLYASSTTSNTFASSDKLFIGSELDTATPSDFYIGQIADVRLYNRKLSDNDVRQLYNWSPGLTTQTATGTYALDLFGSQTSLTYSRRVEYTPAPGNSNAVAVACWIEPSIIGTHTIASSKSASTRANGDWEFQLVSPGYDVLKGWWLLNEGTGTTCYNLASTNYNGAITGSTTWLDAPRGNKGMTFNGSSIYVTLDTGTGTGLSSVLAGNVISTSAWFYPATVSGTIISFTTVAGGLTSYSIFIDASGYISLNAGGSTITTSRLLTINTWNFIAVTITGTTYNIYHNSGEPFATGTLSGQLTINTTDKCIIGAIIPFSSPFTQFSGQIADTRMWNSVLTQPKIHDIYYGNQYLYGSITISNELYTVYDKTPLELNKWYHVGFQYNAKPAILTLFLDGILVQQTQLSYISAGQPALTSSNIVIGAINRSSGTLSQYFQGRISDFKQYNTLLSPAEYTKLAYGQNQQTFKLDTSIIPSNNKYTLDSLVDAGTKYAGSGGQAGSTYVNVYGNMLAQQPGPYGNELLFDGINDYLDISGAYLTRAYNRVFSLGGWVMPSPGPEFPPVADTVNMADSRRNMPGIAYNGYIYVVGGYSGSAYYNYAGRFDGTTWIAETARTFTTAREACAVALYGSLIYMTGGSNGSALASVVTYNGTTWTTLATTLPTAVFNHSSITLGSFLYSIGGNTGSALTSSVNRFNGTAWSSAPALNIPRDGASSVLYNGKIYCIGGRINTSSNESTATVEVFDGTSWTFGPPLTGPRRNFMCSTDGRYIYVAGGVYNFYTDAQNSFTIERFDGVRWQLLPYQTNISRLYAPAVFYSNRMYMIGGYNQSSSTINSVEYMTIPTDTGTVQSYATSTTETIRSAGHCVYNGQLYIIGGFTGSASVNTVKRWDGVSWTIESGNIGTARYSIGCAVSGGFIYIVGGFNGTTYYNTVQRYSIAGGWVTMANYPLSVASVSLVVYNGKLYGIGGNTAATTQTSNIYVYNDSLDIWTVVTTMITARTETSCMVYNNNIHICGGVNGSTALSTTEIFNGGSVRAGVALAGTCRGGFGITINGFIYIFGGIYAGTSSSGTIQRYDDISWTALSQTLLVGRHYAIGGFVNNRLYLTGGIRTGGTTISTTELIQVSGVIISKANATTYTCYSLSYDYVLNSYVFEVGIGEDRVYISAPALRYQYSHVMAVCSGNDGVISLYLNGVLAKSLALADQLSFRGLINISSNLPVLIGKRTGDDGSLFAGKLTDIRVYEMALTAEKIKAIISAVPAGTVTIPQDLDNTSETLAKYPRLANGLICWLSGEDIPASGTKITDHSGQNIRGILQGNTTSTQGRLVGSRSITFDGTGDFINIVQPSQINLKQSALSVAFWFKFTNASASATESIFSLRGAKSAGNSFDIYRVSGTNQVIADFYADTDTTSPQVINNTSWHHFIVTFNGGQTTGIRRTYIDGVLLSTGTSKAWLAYSTVPTTCYIGNNSDNNYFSGQLEDFRIYNRELSQSEIKLLYGTGTQPLYNTASIQQSYSTGTPNQSAQITRYVFNNKGQVINIPLPTIQRDNLICHYPFSKLASRENNGLDGNGKIPDENWKSKPLANYKASSYLSNLNIAIPYNPADINNTQITGSGLYFDTTANLDISSGLVLNNSRDWSMAFYSQVANTSANLSLVSYTAGTTVNNTAFFVNVGNNNELVYRVGASTDYSTGCYLETGVRAHLALTKGTVYSTSNVVSLYKDGKLAYRKQITLDYDGTSIIKLGPAEGYMDDYRIYSSALTPGQVATISGGQDISGPAHHWTFDPALINPGTTPAYGSNIVIDMGSAGISLALSNVTLQNRFTSTDINSANIAVGPGCASFNGTTSFAQAQSPGILRDNPRSILFWMRLASNASPASAQRLLDYGDASQAGGQFAISRATSSKIAVNTGSSGQTVLSSQVINDTAWHHVGVIVLPPGNNTIGNIGTTQNIRIYVDGINTTDMTTLGTTQLQTSKTANAQIDWITVGKANNTNANYYSGLLDDVRIYDVALTPAEITGLYNKWV